MVAGATYAQKTITKADSLNRQAAKYAKNRTASYDPQKALALYTQSASLGNGRAMNAVGVIYNKGLTAPADYQMAMKWYRKAIKAGYLNAYYNLGTLYKDGLGVEQDFEKANKVFEEGIKEGSGLSMYSRGYMYYKGLGGEQNYEKAIQLFRRAIKNGSTASYYMLGVAYRNGYGLTADNDSAKYYFLKAQSKGHPYTKYEIREPKAENSFDMKDLTTGAPVNKSSKQYAKIKEFKESVPNLGNKDISGQYEGFLIKYDWSGKHIIGQSKISLFLKKENDRITGLWVENDTTVTNVSATLEQGSLKFSNTVYRKGVKHSQVAERDYDFRDARLSFTQLGDTASLAGNLKLWSLETFEPETPLYLSLTRVSESKKENKKGSLASTPPDAKAQLKPSAFDEAVIAEVPLKVFPNPFDNMLNVSFLLKEANNVTIMLSDMNGRVVINRSYSLQAGAQLLSVTADVAPGAYVLKVAYGRTVQSNIVIKK